MPEDAKINNPPAADGDSEMLENGTNAEQTSDTLRNEAGVEIDPEQKQKESELENTDPAVTQKQMEEKARNFLAKQTFRVIIPSYAAWFDREEINEIEKKSLPEFFNGKNKTKTPEVYKEYRDFMLDTYRLNPTEYLTVTATRRNLSGDVCSIMRVHAFLEQWGLLNYQIDPETRPSVIGPQFTGHFQVILDTPRGLQPFVPAEGSKATEDGKQLDLTDKKIKASNDELNTMPVNLELRKSIYDSAADASALLDDTQRKQNAINARTYNCFTCGDDVTNVRYHNLQSKQAMGALCFKHGLFPSNFSMSDFIRIEQAQNAGTAWTDQEVLLLLEAIEMFEDDWDAVSYHVGTRNKESCIVKFLQLPIEDPYLIKNSTSALKQQHEKVVEKTKDENSVVSNVLSKLKDNQQEKSQDAVDTPTENIKSRAKQLTTDEEHHQSKLVNSLVEAELRKFEVKMNKFKEMETILDAQRREMEQERLRLYLDRLSLKSQADTVLDKLKQATETGGEEGVELATEASKLAAENPRVSLINSDNEMNQGVKVPKPALKPISIDTPETYKFWSA